MSLDQRHGQLHIPHGLLSAYSCCVLDLMAKGIAGAWGGGGGGRPAPADESLAGVIGLWSWGWGRLLVCLLGRTQRAPQLMQCAGPLGPLGPLVLVPACPQGHLNPAPSPLLTSCPPCLPPALLTGADLVVRDLTKLTFFNMKRLFGAEELVASKQLELEEQMERMGGHGEDEVDDPELDDFDLPSYSSRGAFFSGR